MSESKDHFHNRGFMTAELFIAFRECLICDLALYCAVRYLSGQVEVKLVQSGDLI
jgi:hypothetical protein